DRDHHGRALGVLEEVIADGRLYRAPQLAHVLAVLAALANNALGGVVGHVPQLVHQLLGLLHIDETPGDDFRFAEELAVLNIDDNDHHAVLCQDFAVPQHHSAHVAHAAAVHQHRTGGDRGVGD